MFNYQTSKGMEEKFNFTQLLQKPIAMMTGEELCFLIGKSVESIEKPTSQATSKGNYYGIEGIARVFGCSVPTANRIKKSGVIDKAITQIGRKIVVDADSHCLWQRKLVAFTSRSERMDENWKQQLATDSYGNPVRSISNLRLIFTLDENLSQIRYDTFVRMMCVSILCSAMSMAIRLMRSRWEDTGLSGRTYRLRLTQNKVFEILKRPHRNGVQSCAGIHNSRDMGRTAPYSHGYH